MTEQLLDEVEAINSIYGDTSLKSTEDKYVYVLNLPDETVSLRLQFPLDYPSVPPIILGTQSSGENGKRGAAARNLGLFRDAVAAVYEPGQVCLFDAIEKLKDLLETARQDGADPATSAEGAAAKAVLEHVTCHAAMPEPRWVMSDLVVELKSTFVARCVSVTSAAQAAQFVQHLLAVDRKVRTATHNMTAWRIRGPGGTSFQDCDDDGETAAGGRLLHLMQLMDLWDTMVVVTRWYGGQKLGPRRFALINAAARDAFVKAGLVPDVCRKKGNSR